ncbi:hypothetical protein KIPB_001901 [Kipferlia bialata]|uniref:Uncharacterized protein n=1 Tax=Kipferlia bialata TaxID=797122 RepID=A0A9K3CPM3_9EUKA|nr:hypothetical protein KIPB_001901 [Kipferlia bialata]|eukprot:g1901.t1
MGFTILYLVYKKCEPGGYKVVIGVTDGKETDENEVPLYFKNKYHDHTVVQFHCWRDGSKHRVLPDEYSRYTPKQLEDVLRCWMADVHERDPRTRCVTKEVERGHLTKGCKDGSHETIMVVTTPDGLTPPERYPSLAHILDHAVTQLSTTPSVPEGVRSFSLKSCDHRLFICHYLLRGAMLGRIRMHAVLIVLCSVICVSFAVENTDPGTLAQTGLLEHRHTLSPVIKDSPASTSPADFTPVSLQPATAEGAQAGFSVSSDGKWLAVGAPYESGDNGRVYIYEWTATPTGEDWTLHTTLNPPAFSLDYYPPKFGTSVALAGTHLAVGIPDLHCQNPSSYRHYHSGGVVTYELSGDTWEYLTHISGHQCATEYAGSKMVMQGDALLHSGWDRTWVSFYSGGTWGPAITFSEECTNYPDIDMQGDWAVIACAYEKWVAIYDTTEPEWSSTPFQVLSMNAWPSTSSWWDPNQVSVAVDGTGDTPRLVVSQGYKPPYTAEVFSLKMTEDPPHWTVDQVLDTEQIEDAGFRGGTMVLCTDERVGMYTLSEQETWELGYSFTPQLNNDIGQVQWNDVGLFVGAPHLNLDSTPNTGGVQVFSAASICLVETDVDANTSTLNGFSSSVSVESEVSVSVTLCTSAGTAYPLEMSVVVVYEASQAQCEWGSGSTYSCPMSFTDTARDSYEVLVGCLGSPPVSFMSGTVEVVPGAFDLAATQTHYLTVFTGAAETVPQSVTTDNDVTVVLKVFDRLGNRILTRPDSLYFSAIITGPVTPAVPLWSGPAAWSTDEAAYLIGQASDSIRLLVPGVHSVVFRDSTDPSSSVTLSLDVSHGVPSFITSMLSPLSAPAGTITGVTVVPFDAAGNEITTDIVAQVSLDALDPAAAEVPYTDGVGFQTSLSLPTKAGPNRVLVSISGDGVDGSPILDLELYVLADTPHGIDVEGVLALSHQDETASLYLSFTLTDAYDNDFYTGTPTYLYVTAEGEGTKTLCTYSDGLYHVARPLGAVGTGTHGVTVTWGETGSVSDSVTVGAILSADVTSARVITPRPSVMEQVTVYVSLFDASATLYPSPVEVGVEWEGQYAECVHSIGDHAYVCSMVFEEETTTSFTIAVSEPRGERCYTLLTESISLANAGYDASLTRLHHSNNPLTTSPATPTAGSPFTVILQLYDVYGNVILEEPAGTSFTARIVSRESSADVVFEGPMSWSTQYQGHTTGYITISDLTLLGDSFDVTFLSTDDTPIETSLFVVPSVPVLSTSSISSLDGAVGDHLTVTAVLRDQYGNEVADVSTRMAFDSPDPAAVAVTHTAGLGYRHSLTLPTVAGDHHLFVTLSGGSLESPTDIVFTTHVTPGVSSMLSVASDFLVQGQVSTVSFSVTDAHGNPDTQEHEIWFYVVSAGYDSRTQCTRTVTAEGVVYSAEVDMADHGVGVHDVRAVLSSGVTCEGVFTVTQLLSAENSTTPTGLSLVAGETTSVEVVVSDTLGQAYTSPVRVTVTCEGTQSLCVYFNDPSGEGVFYSCPLSASDTATTTYQVFVAPATDSAAGTLLTAGTVEVSPAVVSGTQTQVMYDSTMNSVALTEPSEPVAEQGFAVILEAFDAFGNPVLEDPSLSVTARVSSQTSTVPLWTGDASWDAQKAGFVTASTGITLQESGTYSVTFTILGGPDQDASASDTVSVYVIVAEAEEEVDPEPEPEPVPVPEGQSFTPMDMVLMGMVGTLLLSLGVTCCCCWRVQMRTQKAFARLTSANPGNKDTTAIDTVVPLPQAVEQPGVMMIGHMVQSGQEQRGVLPGTVYP